MFIEVVKSKIHKVTVTEANLQYVGSITIDVALMEAANIIENEKVHCKRKQRRKTGDIRNKRRKRLRGSLPERTSRQKMCCGGYSNHHFLCFYGF